MRQAPERSEEVVTGEVPSSRNSDWIVSSRSMIVESLTRPYRVTIPMVILVAMVPFYLFIPDLTPSKTFNTPDLPVDAIIPLQPAWALVYGALYFFLIVLPILVVRDEELLRRTVLAYLSVWITAYVCFVIYPTVAPRPAEVTGSGFAAWGLRSLYGADPPYNCFPSLHVAHSFVSAFACYRVHRRLGIATFVIASLVALSTLFTKQHYVLDVAAGVFLASMANVVFLRRYPHLAESHVDRRTAPLMALLTMVVAITGVAGFWLLYRFGATL